jgi:CBS domain-containing protein
MALSASDVMQTGIVTVSPELPLLDVHRLFVAEEIHGAPVIDEDGVVSGVVSSADLLRVVAEEHGVAGVAVDYLRDLVEFSGPDWASTPEDFQNRLGDLSVRDAMTPNVVTVSPDATVGEVARILCENRVHRVLVTENDQLLGIISTLDLVAVLRDDSGRRELESARRADVLPEGT